MAAKIKRPPTSADRHRHKPKKVSKKAFEKVYWPYLPLLAVISLLLIFSGPSGALQSAISARHGRVLAYATSMSVSGLLADTNTARLHNGIHSLSLNSKLIAAAQAKANDMATRNYWSHYTPEGNPPWVFVTAQGYAYQKLGENLAAGFDTEQATIDGWMASPPHRENMLDPAFSEVGFGYANNPDYTSAGGGPMTIVVAFYGEPVAVTKAPAPVPVTHTSTPTAPPTASTPPTASKSVPKPATKPKTVAKAPASKPKPAKNQPVNTETTAQQSKGISLSYRTTGAQLAFAQAPVSSLATGLVIFIGIAAAGIWASRHLLRFRRMLLYGERYALHHPLFDAGLLILGTLAYLLTQTVGLIQ